MGGRLPVGTAACPGVVDELRIEGFRMQRSVLVYRPARTLVVADLVQNIGRPRHRWTAVYTRTMGMYDRVALSRMIRWAAFSDRTAARRSLDALLTHPFDRLVVGHGAPAGGLQLAADSSILRSQRRRNLRPRQHQREENVGRQLIRGWERAARDLERRIRTPPELVNTDGDALLITTDHFSFDPERRSETLASLTAMDDVTPPDDGRTAGNACFTFLRTGNAMHASWENTVVGTASLEADHLRLETNSVRRADDLRGRVASACGSLLRHDRREQVDPLVEMAENRERHAEPPAPDPPEASAMLRAYKARHYADWIDQALPALRGKTPRAAARSAWRSRRLLLSHPRAHAKVAPEEHTHD